MVVLSRSLTQVVTHLVVSSVRSKRMQRSKQEKAYCSSQRETKKGQSTLTACRRSQLLAIPPTSTFMCSFQEHNTMSDNHLQCRRYPERYLTLVPLPWSQRSILVHMYLHRKTSSMSSEPWLGFLPAAEPSSSQLQLLERDRCQVSCRVDRDCLSELCHLGRLTKLTFHPDTTCRQRLFSRP